MSNDRLSELEAALLDAVKDIERIVYFWNVLEAIRERKTQEHREESP